MLPAAVDIRPAVVADVPLILSFIRELAAYEKLADAVVADAAALCETLFGARPAAEVLLAFLEDAPAGFALFFPSYSTFLARPGLYLEDLFVKPPVRGRGVGRALLQRVAALAVARGCGRCEWAVLDWNEPAAGFYRRLGARTLDDWTVWRLDGRALETLAGEDA